MARKRTQQEIRVQCRELDGAFAHSDERKIRDALFALVPKVCRVLDNVQTLQLGAPPFVWQPHEIRQGSNGPTEEWEVSCRADAAPGVPPAAVSALISFYNPYTGGGYKLQAQIAGTGAGGLYSFWAFWVEAYPSTDTRPSSFRVKFAPPLTPNEVAAAFAAVFGERS